MWSDGGGNVQERSFGILLRNNNDDDVAASVEDSMTMV
jgi:hypothetical protein